MKKASPWRLRRRWLISTTKLRSRRLLRSDQQLDQYGRRYAQNGRNQPRQEPDCPAQRFYFGAQALLYTLDLGIEALGRVFQLLSCGNRLRDLITQRLGLRFGLLLVETRVLQAFGVAQGIEHAKNVRLISGVGQLHGNIVSAARPRSVGRMRIETFPTFARSHWSAIHQRLTGGRYQP